MELTKVKNDVLNHLQKLDKKERIKLGGAVMLGLLFIIFIFWPAWVLRPSVKGKIQGLKSSLAAAESKIRLEPKMLEEKKSHEAFLQNSISRFFTGPETQGLASVLTEMGEKNGVKLLSTQSEKDAGNIPGDYRDKYSALTYLVAVEGGFHSLGSFMSDIENYKKFLRVDELSVTPQEDAPKQLVGEIRVTGFLLKQPIPQTKAGHAAQ